VARYTQRLSGPLLDRIDLQVEVAALSYAEMQGGPAEPSAAVAVRVEAARRRQLVRLPDTALNARLRARELRQVAALDAAGHRLLARAVDRMGLSARTHDRVLRMARTIADLADSSTVGADHVAEALAFRRCTVDTG
jgi:magnesium chelatase family protein